MGARWAERVGTRRLLALATLAVFGLHLWLSAKTTGPWVVPDEGGYLGNARWLMGDRNWPMPNAPFYAAGYSVAVAPVFGLTDDPHLQWRLLVTLNAALLAATLPLLHLALRRVFGVPARRALVAATIGAVIPGLLATGFSGVSESLVAPLVPASILACWLLARPTTHRALQLWFGPSVAILAFAHPRFTLVLPFAVVLLIVAAARRQVPRSVAAANLAGLAFTAIAARLLNHALEAARWRTVQRPEGGRQEWVDLLTTKEGFREFVATAAGQGWYLLVGSFGLVAIGIAIAIHHIWRPRPLAPGPRSVSVHRSAQRLGLVYLVGASGAVFATSVLFFTQNQFRLDHYIYGRHNDSFTPIWVGLATAFLLSPQPTRRRVMAVAASVVPLIIMGMVVVHERDPLDFRHRVSSFSIPAILRIMTLDVDRSFAVVTVIGAIGVLFILAIVALEALPRRIGPISLRWTVVARVVLVIALGSWFVTAGLDASDRAEAYDRIQYEDWHSPADLQRLGVTDLSLDADVAGSRHSLTYPFFLPGVRFHMYNGFRETPATPIALAASTDEARVAAGDRIALLDQRVSYAWADLPQGLAVWVAAGPEHDALDARGALLPVGFPTDLPVSARAADLAIVDPPTEPIAVVPGGRVRLDIRLAHTGTGSPWPDRNSWQSPGHVRVVALISPEDPDGIPGARSGGELPQWMLPGDEVSAVVEVVAVGQFLQPLPPGRYRVELAVSQDGYDWTAPGGPGATFTMTVTG